MVSVALVSCPFGSLDRPALGLGLLQAGLQRAGVSCATRHLGFVFADQIGAGEYRWLADDLPYTAFAGEWVFAAALSPSLDGAGYVRQVLRGTWGLDDQAVARVLRIRAAVGPFLDACVEAPGWRDIDVVGFTSTFAQNVASLALAARLKARHPHLTTVLGGANVEGEMGRAIHAAYPHAIDVVVSGEGDRTLPALVAALDAGADPATVPGVVVRRDGDSVATGSAPLVTDLDALAPPDHDAFFADRAASTAAAGPTPRLLLETSRGCWWGAKHHCTFCGLNGAAMRFRSKSPERAFDELAALTGRYGLTHVDVVDNILDPHYLRTFLPRLATSDLDVRLFYEVKANLTLDQVQLLAAAGVHGIQPGIESLSDHVLRLMDKGTTTLQNVQLLRWCEEQGVVAEWNVLYGFPGETSDDVAEVVRVVDAIDFLRPPSGLGPIRLDRFSPYHDDPGRYGIVDVRPLAVYHHLYDLPEDELGRVACYFDFAHADGGDREAAATPLVERVQRWMREGPCGRLERRRDGDRIEVGDTRPDTRGTVTLEGWRAAVYVAADRVRTLRGLRDVADVPAAELERFIDACAARRLLLRTGDRVLALAVHRPARAWDPSRPDTTVTSTADVAGARTAGVRDASSRELLPMLAATTGSR